MRHTGSLPFLERPTPLLPGPPLLPGDVFRNASRLATLPLDRRAMVRCGGSLSSRFSNGPVPGRPRHHRSTGRLPERLRVHPLPVADPETVGNAPRTVKDQGVGPGVGPPTSSRIPVARPLTERKGRPGPVAGGSHDNQRYEMVNLFSFPALSRQEAATRSANRRRLPDAFSAACRPQT